MAVLLHALSWQGCNGMQKQHFSLGIILEEEKIDVNYNLKEIKLKEKQCCGAPCAQRTEWNERGELKKETVIAIICRAILGEY